MNWFKKLLYGATLRKDAQQEKKTVQASALPETWRRLRSSYGQTPTLYEALGYPSSITYHDYLHRYNRQDIANRVIRAPVDATWRYDPEVDDSNQDDDEFKESWAALVKEVNLYSKLRRLDILANIGRYAVLYLGFEGDVVLSEPPSMNSKLFFVTPFSEINARITQFDSDPASVRCGLPQYYEIESAVETDNPITNTVHWSRIIHIAEGSVDNEIYGIPKLQPIYNRLIGLEKLAGGSPEMFWLGARPGYVAKAPENSILDTATFSELQGQLSDFVNYQTRWMFAAGVDIEALAPQVSSPLEHVEVQLKLISSATNIPIRILVGSEKGELASGQDERAWHSYVDMRRQHVAEDLILNPLLDRLIFLNSLPEPQNGYDIRWKSINITSDNERAEIARTITEAMEKYASTPGASLLVPPEMWLEKVLGFSEQEINKIVKDRDSYLTEEDLTRSTNENNEDE